MKKIILDFINNYDKSIIIDYEKVEHIVYENKEQIYIDLGKHQYTDNLIENLKLDFKVETLALNLDDGFVVYEFYIGSDVSLGEYEVKGYGFHEVFNVETRVHLIDRNYKTVYHNYLNSIEWYKKRNITLKYADYKCNRCKETENLQIHHLNYNSIGNEVIGDLEVLCNKCHKKVHKII